MDILVINGSPKGEGSDTMRITRAFLEGMGERAQVIETVRANIKPCVGCFGCWHKTPGRCAIEDDMADILGRITAADLVIWSAPLYCYGVPSHCKALIDRLLPLSTPAQLVDAQGRTYHPSQKPVAARMLLISGCGFPDMEGNFDGLRFQFRRLFGEDMAMILCMEAPLLSIPEAAPVAAPYLALARRAGEEYRANGRISAQTQAALDSPMYPPDLYRRDVSGG